MRTILPLLCMLVKHEKKHDMFLYSKNGPHAFREYGFHALKRKIKEVKKTRKGLINKLQTAHCDFRAMNVWWYNNLPDKLKHIKIPTNKELDETERLVKEYQETFFGLLSIWGKANQKFPNLKERLNAFYEFHAKELNVTPHQLYYRVLSLEEET